MLFYGSILIVTLVSHTWAQFLPYFYPSGSQETAVSLNNAPVGLYGRTSNGYGGTEEYAVSMSGAPVGVYGKRNGYSERPYLLSLWDYWALLYALNYFQYDFLQESPKVSPTAAVDSRLHDVSAISPRAWRIEPRAWRLEPRSFSGSVSVAASSADAERQKTKAQAVSLQGELSSSDIQDFFGF